MTSNTTPDRFMAVHNFGHVHLEDSMGSDLHIVNNARVSFDQESSGFTEKERGLLNFLMRERHGSPWESVVYRFDVKAPIFVIREWQRHRMGCLTADTQVSFVNTNGVAPTSLRKSMGELHRMWTEGEVNGIATPQTTVEAVLDFQKSHPGASKRAIGRACGVSHMTVAKILDGQHTPMRDGKWRVRKMKLRVLDEECGEFTTGHITNVVDSGTKPVYWVTAADGRQIEMTEDHQVLTDTGWKRLGDAVGIEDTVATWTTDVFLLSNGLDAIESPEWLAAKREAGLTLSEIAAEAGVSVAKTRRSLKKFGLTSALRGPGPLTDEGRQAIREARGGARSNFWRGGRSTERQRIGRWAREQAPKVHARYQWTCQACNSRGGQLHAHHILPVTFAPESAYDFDNLITLCADCHRATHRSAITELTLAGQILDRPLPSAADLPRQRGRKLVAHKARIISVQYVGVKQTYDLSVDDPWHNFVANGFVVHNSFNEQSARYSQVPDHYYIPEDEYVRQQLGKPGAYFFGQIEDPIVRARTIDLIDETQRNAFEAYHQMLDDGIAKELARTVLPVGMFSRMKWTVNLRGLFNFLSLRNHEHAQREIRDYAQAVEKLAAEVCPVAFECFESHGRTCP